MEVTKSNFKSVLSDIKDAITESSFLSIDCEFSGLTFDTNVKAFDTYSQYYDKLRQNVGRFLCFQFGLGVFRYDESSEKFKQKCYNFYIFPRPINKFVPDVRFNCQASSIDFLASHNFDFNKVFKEGICYLNKHNETKYKENMLERQKIRAQSQPARDSNHILVPDEEKSFLDETMKNIQTFLDSTDEELQLPMCNAFRRRLIYQTAGEQFENKVIIQTRVLEKKMRCLFVIRHDAEVKKSQETKKCEEENLEFEEAIGFSSIIQHIAESGKLLVGHNLMLDLLHTVDKFLTPLPDCYDEFKECVNCLFPKIIDTKLMASSEPMKEFIQSTVLCDILTTLKSSPFEISEFEIDKNGVGYTLSDDKEHEAGYDAYITGLSYLTMVKYLAKEAGISPQVACNDWKLLAPYLNKLVVMRLQDCPFMNLTGKDPTPSRDHVLHCSFPNTWKQSDIIQLFSPFGNVFVSWLNDKSAYVALQRREQAVSALKALGKSTLCTVISYARHQSITNTNLQVTPSPKLIRTQKDAFGSNNKKQNRARGLGQSSSKRKFETITEQPEEESEPVVSKMVKLFDENAAWD